jgi:hypothetical protein
MDQKATSTPQEFCNPKLMGPISKTAQCGLCLGAGKWMELENIILSEVSLAQKTKNRMFSLICGH